MSEIRNIIATLLLSCGLLVCAGAVGGLEYGSIGFGGFAIRAAIGLALLLAAFPVGVGAKGGEDDDRS